MQLHIRNGKGGIQKAIKQMLLGHASLNPTARYAHLTAIKQHSSVLAINQLTEALTLEWELS